MASASQVDGLARNKFFLAGLRIDYFKEEHTFFRFVVAVHLPSFGIVDV